MPRFAVLENRMLLAAVLPVIDGFALDSNLDGTFDSVSATGLVDVHKSTTSQATGLFEFAVPFTSTVTASPAFRTTTMSTPFLLASVRFAVRPIR